MRFLSTAVFSLASVLALATLAHGDLIQYSDRDTFNTQGTVLFECGFDDVGTSDENGFYYPGTPWSTCGVTYSAGTNAVLLQDSTPFKPASNVFVNIFGTITASIEGGTAGFDIDMFAMDVAALDATGSSSALLKTNVNPTGYNISLSGLPNVSASQRFFGFVTDTPGEYFTEFVVYFGAVQPTIDNVTLGVVPEPATLTLLGIAVLGLGAAGLRRRKP